MPTLNETLRDRVIRHAAMLERYKRGVARDIVRLLEDELQPAILAQLERRMARIAEKGYDRGLETTKRLRDLAAGIDQIVKEVSLTARNSLTGTLHDLAQAEARWTQGLVSGALAKTPGVEFVLPSPATLRTIVTQGPINGALLKDWFQAFEDSTKQAITRQLNIGLVSGETVPQLRNRLLESGVFEGSKREAETIVRTASSHVSAATRHAVNAENADVVKGEQWVATLDHRTCRVCGPLDGKVFDLDDGQRPPAHPNCRCSLVPVLKSWEELGIEADELDAGTRASMNGQVADTVTFGDWLKTQPQDAVADVLGSQKAAQKFLAGEVDLDQFSTKWGKPLSLKAAMARS